MQSHPALVEIARILLEAEIERQRRQKEAAAASQAGRQDDAAATSTKQAKAARPRESTPASPTKANRGQPMTTAIEHTLAIIHTIQAEQPLNGLTAANCGEWSDIMTEAIRAYTQAGKEAALLAITRDPELLKLASAGEPPPRPVDPWRMVDILPDLPAYARLTAAQEREAQESNLYLNTYLGYARSLVPMLPDYFHESAALFLGSVAIARRLSLNMGFDVIYPNLYILWTAATTIYNKSTALRIPMRLMEQVMPHLRLSSEFSREALIDSLAGKPPTNQAELNLTEDGQKRFQLSKKFAAQRGLILDEASALFTGLKREMNIGLTELLLKGYDCENFDRDTLKGGLVQVKKPYLSFLGATTPVMLKQSDSTRLWLSGLWARFNLLVPRTLPNRLLEVTHIPPQPDLLASQLDRLANYHLSPPEDFYHFPDARCVTLTEPVRLAFQAYRRALVEGIVMSNSKPPEELHGPYGRLPTAALKVAVILAAFDWTGQGGVPTIEPAHWYRAQMIAETWREGAHRLYRELNEAADLDSQEQRIVQIVTRRDANGEECARRDVYRVLNKKALEVNPIIDQMIDAGLLKERPIEGTRKRLLFPGDSLPVNLASS